MSIRVTDFTEAEEALEAVEEFLAGIARRNPTDAAEAAWEASERFANLNANLQGRPG